MLHKNKEKLSRIVTDKFIAGLFLLHFIIDYFTLEYVEKHISFPSFRELANLQIEPFSYLYGSVLFLGTAGLLVLAFRLFSLRLVDEKDKNQINVLSVVYLCSLVFYLAINICSSLPFSQNYINFFTEKTTIDGLEIIHFYLKEFIFEGYQNVALPFFSMLFYSYVAKGMYRIFSGPFKLVLAGIIVEGWAYVLLSYVSIFKYDYDYPVYLNTLDDIGLEIVRIGLILICIIKLVKSTLAAKKINS